MKSSIFVLRSSIRSLTRFQANSRAVLIADVRCMCSSSSSAAIAAVTDLSAMEFRIGKIMEISKHPDASGLYVEKIDIGEPSGRRTIVSGLAQFLTEDQLLNRHVIVLCNLKPRNIKGITSNGMIMCVSNESHTKVDPITPPADAAIGELITFPGHASAPIEAGNKATKQFTKIADFFHSDDKGVAYFKDAPFSTSKGLVTAQFKGKIS